MVVKGKKSGSRKTRVKSPDSKKKKTSSSKKTLSKKSVKKQSNTAKNKQIYNDVGDIQFDSSKVNKKLEDLDKSADSAFESLKNTDLKMDDVLGLPPLPKDEEVEDTKEIVDEAEKEIFEEKEDNKNNKNEEILDKPYQPDNKINSNDTYENKQDKPELITKDELDTHKESFFEKLLSDGKNDKKKSKKDVKDKKDNGGFLEKISKESPKELEKDADKYFDAEEAKEFDKDVEVLEKLEKDFDNALENKKDQKDNDKKKSKKDVKDKKEISKSNQKTQDNKDLQMPPEIPNHIKEDPYDSLKADMKNQAKKNQEEIDKNNKEHIKSLPPVDNKFKLEKKKGFFEKLFSGFTKKKTRSSESMSSENNKNKFNIKDKNKDVTSDKNVNSKINYEDDDLGLVDLKSLPDIAQGKTPAIEKEEPKASDFSVATIDNPKTDSSKKDSVIIEENDDGENSKTSNEKSKDVSVAEEQIAYDISMPTQYSEKAPESSLSGNDNQKEDIEKETNAKDNKSNKKDSDSDNKKQDSLGGKKEITSKDIKKYSSVLEKSVAKLESKRDKLQIEIQELNRQVKDKSVWIDEQTNHIEKTQKNLDRREKELDERENILLALQTDLIKERKELDNREFRLFMQEEKSNLVPNNKIDVVEPQLRSLPHGMSDGKLRIEQLMNQTRSLAINNKFDEAQGSYNRLVQEFHNASLSPEERKMVHLSIRDLYNDILILMKTQQQS